MVDRYGSVDSFSAYVLARNYDLPAAEPDEIAAALLVASTWLDGRYSSAFRQAGSGARFYGGQYSLTDGTLKAGGRAQVREWPRIGFVDRDGHPIPADEVPREIEEATFEAAIRQLVKPGSLNSDFTQSKSYKSIAIEGAISVVFAGAGSAADAQLMIPIIDQILSPLIGGSESSSLSGRSARG